MKRARSVFAVFAVLTLASTAAAQDREYIRLLEKLLVGASGAINAEITDLRRQLARCDGPANQRLPSDNCAARTLIQAQLNYLLRMGMAFGDPDTAGTRVVALPPPRPPDLTDFRNLRAVLFEKVRAEPTRDIVHVISEDRAKLEIVYHCAAMLDFDANGLKALMTTEEVIAVQSADGNAKIKADVNACINEYDAKEVSANRKAAIEYCFQSNNYVTDSSYALFDTCMLTHDMIQAMCKQMFEQAQNWSMRKLPGTQRGMPVACFDRQARPNPREIQAILSAPAAGTMAELPPKFLAVPPAPPPHPSYPTPVPPVPIPTGTVLDTTLIGQIYPVFVEEGLGQGVIVQARLDRPLVIGGLTALPTPNVISLKARIIGPGTRPNSVLIGFTTYWAYWGRTKGGQIAGYDLKSDELVFTVARRGSAPGLSSFVPLDTKLRFTLRSTASSAAPAAGASTATPAQPAPVPPTASAPPPAAPPPAPAPPDRQQQAEERRKQAERQVACLQQATKDHPRGGLELAQAIAACAQAK